MGRLVQPSGLRPVRRFSVDSETFSRPNDTTQYGAYDAILPTGTYDCIEIPRVTATGNRLVNIRNLKVSQSIAPAASVSYQVAVFGESFTGANNVDNAIVKIPYGVTEFFRSGAVTVFGGANQGNLQLVVEASAVMRTDANGSLWYLLIANIAINTAANCEYFVTLDGVEYDEN